MPRARRWIKRGLLALLNRSQLQQLLDLFDQCGQVGVYERHCRRGDTATLDFGWNMFMMRRLEGIHAAPPAR